MSDGIETLVIRNRLGASDVRFPDRVTTCASWPANSDSFVPTHVTPPELVPSRVKPLATVPVQPPVAVPDVPLIIGLLISPPPPGCCAGARFMFAIIACAIADPMAEAPTALGCTWSARYPGRVVQTGCEGSVIIPSRSTKSQPGWF